MNVCSILNSENSLDEVFASYEVLGSGQGYIGESDVTVPLQSLSVKRGKRDGELYYIIEDVAFEDAEVCELVQQDWSLIMRSLNASLLFEDIDNPKSTRDEYKRKRDAGISETVTLWDNVVLAESDRKAIETLVGREFLQSGVLTAPFMDESVDCVRVTRSGVVVECEGDEYQTNISVVEESLREQIIYLAQRVGEHISSADP